MDQNNCNHNFQIMDYSYEELLVILQKILTNHVLTKEQYETLVSKGGNTFANFSTFSGDYRDLDNKPFIPTKLSELEDDYGFVGEAELNTKVESNKQELTNKIDAQVENIANTYISKNDFNNSLNNLQAKIDANKAEQEEAIANHEEEVRLENYRRDQIDAQITERLNELLDESTGLYITTKHEVDNIAQTKISTEAANAIIEGLRSDIDSILDMFGEIDLSDLIALLEEEDARLAEQLQAEIDRARAAETVNAEAIAAINDPNTGLLQQAKEYSDSKVASILGDGALIEELDTLKELAQAIGDNPNFATEIVQGLANKVDKEEGKGLSSNDFTRQYKTLLDEILARGSSSDFVQYILNTYLETDGAFRVILNTKVDKEEGKSLSSNDYTDEDKAIVDEIKEQGTAENFVHSLIRDSLLSSDSDFSMGKVLDDRLDGLTFNKLTEEEYNALSDEDKTNKNMLYIITSGQTIAVDDFITKEELATQINRKINKSEVINNLTSTDFQKPLSALQGKVLAEEWLGGKKHVYLTEVEYATLLNSNAIDESTIYHITDADTIYGLTEEQMLYLKVAYEHAMEDNDLLFASAEEINKARIDSEGKAYTTLSDRLLAIDNYLDELNYVSENISDSLEVYGVEYDFEEYEYTRLLSARNMQPSDFNSVYPWAGMRRCNVLDGNVVCYEGDEEYKEDGSNGDVMVEIPKFYYQVVPVRTEPSATGVGLQLLQAKWMITSKPKMGFKVHPAFIKDGGEVNHVYVGAFEGCAYNVETNSILMNDEQTVNFNTDKLMSIKGAQPITGTSQNFNYNNFEKICTNKGDGYVPFKINTLSALQLLFLIEHASFDCQEALGRGIVDLEEVEKPNVGTLVTGSIGAVIYRGIENLWGNSWEFAHGMYANEDFVLPYGDIKLVDGKGFIDRFCYHNVYDYWFFPSRISGASSVAPHDYYTSAPNGIHCFIFGGRWAYGDKAGLWCLNLSNNTTSASRLFTGRLQFYK